MGFADEVRRGHRNARERVALAVQKITIQAVNEIIQSSPVDTGRFRGNWQSSIGSINYATNEGLDPSGENAKREAEFTISGFEMGTVFYFSNSLPYARRLEYGYSLQAPSPPGIVRAAALRSRQLQEQVFSSLR